MLTCGLLFHFLYPIPFPILFFASLPFLQVMSASIPPCEGGTQRKDAIETRLSTQPPKETTSLNDVSHQTPDDNQHQALPTTKIVESDNQQVISPSPTIVRQSSEVP